MSNEIEMPRYQSHKQVWALKISEIRTSIYAGFFSIVFEDKDYASVRVDAEWVRAKKPEAGGYYVVYPGDGYASYSPAKAFEDGYVAVDAQSAASRCRAEGGDTSASNVSNLAAKAPAAQAVTDYNDPTLACSSCGLTMGESRTLGHIKLGILAASPASTPEAATEQQDQVNVLPPFAAPAGQQDIADAALCKNINALLALDADGALVPHGIGGHARELLKQAATRLAGSARQGGITNNSSANLAANTAGAAATSEDALDAGMFRWLEQNRTWRTRYRIKGGKPIEWQMLDDGEPWGQWGELRNVIDAARAVVASRSRAEGGLGAKCGGTGCRDLSCLACGGSGESGQEGEQPTNNKGESNG